MGFLHTGTTQLAEAFLREVRCFNKKEDGKYDCSPEYKGRIFYEAEQLLRLGVSLERMLAVCLSSDESDRYTYGLMDFMKNKGIHIPKRFKYPRESDECIQMGAFYYHPVLQEAPPPSRTILDWNTMELTVLPSESFYLEIRDSFRLEDVVRYFLKETGSDEEMLLMKRLIGQFRNTIQHYGIDFTLYLIDAGVAHALDEKRRMPRNTSDLIDNIDIAKQMYETRKLTCWEGGLSRVYPRERSTESVD